MHIQNINKNSGFSMIEVLVTMIIILVGLLGIAGLQIRAQLTEMESYQRAQALIIMSDITDKMYINRETADCFAITSNTTSGTPYLGTAGANHIGTPTCTSSTSAYNTQAVNTMQMINTQLTGAAETFGGNNVGSMIGARACVSYDNTDLINGRPGTGPYTLIVTWQGLADIVAPTNMNCGVGLYGNETNRRAVSTTIRLGALN